MHWAVKSLDEAFPSLEDKQFDLPRQPALAGNIQLADDTNRSRQANGMVARIILLEHVRNYVFGFRLA